MTRRIGLQHLLAAFSFAICLAATLHAGENVAPVEVYNRGIGGNSTADGLVRFEADVMADRPQWLVMGFGMNDAVNPARMLEADAYEKNLQALIDLARANGIEHLVLLTINPIIEQYLFQRHQNHPLKDTAAKIKSLNEVIIRLAEKNQLTLVDLHAAVEAHGGATLEQSSLLRNEANSKSPDGVHFTAQGYELMASLISEAIKEQEIGRAHV